MHIVSTILSILVSAAPVERPPNIVLVMADDLGWNEVGAYGQEKIRTPNMDRLAAEGMLLTDHYSGSAVCAPSRCVLMTGKHTGHAVVRAARAVFLDTAAELGEDQDQSVATGLGALEVLEEGA